MNYGIVALICGILFVIALRSIAKGIKPRRW